ncbi:MAG: hypothetical protein QHJ81_10120 [Anaerolineae bacterium]|nr:hypothetical protein [Anaerolineae bacterium]
MYHVTGRFAERLAADEAVARLLSPQELNSLPDPATALMHLDEVFERLDDL